MTSRFSSKRTPPVPTMVNSPAPTGNPDGRVNVALRVTPKLIIIIVIISIILIIIHRREYTWSNCACAFNTLLTDG